MKHTVAVVMAGAALSLVLLVPQPAAAQAAKAAPSAIPRTLDGKPDMNGVWEHPYSPDMSKNGRDSVGAGPLPYTAEYAQKFKDYDPAKFDYTGACLPQGHTRQMNSPFPLQIVQTPQTVAFLYEAWMVFEVVPVGGQHKKDPDPLWAGEHVGRWEGDTFVIDTIAYNDKTNLDTIGHPHSDALHTVERLTVTDDKHLAYEITVEDPKAFTRPWKNTRTFTRRPDWQIMEYSCEENNKDAREGHINSK